MGTIKQPIGRTNFCDIVKIRYVETQDRLKIYNYQYYGKDCYIFYNWFFKKDEISNTDTFKIPLSVIQEK